MASPDPCLQSPNALSQKRGEPVAGLPALERIIRGEAFVSGGARTLGISLFTAQRGAVVLQAKTTEESLNSGGTVHGGIVAGWVDCALAFATASVIDEGVGYSSIDLNVRYLRAIKLDTSPCTVRATVTHAGRSTTVVDVTISDGTGRLCATGSGVLMMFHPETPTSHRPPIAGRE